jgi:hypothetical protein
MYLIEASDLKLSMSTDDVKQIAFDIKRVLLDVAEDHWLKWYKNDNKETTQLTPVGFATYVHNKEQDRLERIKFLFGICGMGYIYENTDNELKDIYNKSNDWRS